MNHFHVPNLVSLGIIVAALLAGVLVSLARSSSSGDGHGATPE
jgi:hypothetical protein